MAVGLASITAALVLALTAVLPEEASVAAAPDRAVDTESDPLALPLTEHVPRSSSGTDHQDPHARLFGAAEVGSPVAVLRDRATRIEAPPQQRLLDVAPKTSPPR